MLDGRGVEWEGRWPVPTRLVVIARARFYRDGLAGLFATRDGYAVVASGTAADALDVILEHRPDIVLLALDGDADAGPALVREIVASAPATRVVSIGVSDDDPRVVALAEAGVAGYVTAEAGAPDLVNVVDAVARGEAPCSPRIARALLSRLATLSRAQRGPERPGSALTAREQQIVALIDRGLSNKEIARLLCIEVATVKNHVHNLLEKLQVKRRGEAAALVRQAAQ